MATEDPVQTRRKDEWAAFLKYLEESESWVAAGLLPVARLASAHPRLGLLFPFQSLNQLCFSRCSDLPYTNDCPCIAVNRAGEYGVSTFPYYWGQPEEDPRPWLPLPRDADEAIAIAAAALPPNADEVWVGKATDRRPDG